MRFAGQRGPPAEEVTVQNGGGEATSQGRRNLLSKRKESSIVKYRETWLPLPSGRLKTTRQRMTGIVLEHLSHINDEERLFPFGRSRAWEIVHSISPDFWCHLFRALGENFLYDAWDHDMLAVSDYVKVNPRTLEKYIRRSYEKYKSV
jgi:hypothetical protein